MPHLPLGRGTPNMPLLGPYLTLKLELLLLCGSLREMAPFRPLFGVNLTVYGLFGPFDP